MRKGIVIFIIGLFIGTSILPAIGGYNESNLLNNPDQLDQEQPNWWQGGTVIFNCFYAAQAFKPNLNVLSKVELWLYKYNNPPNDLIISIRKVLTGPDLSLVTIPKEDIDWGPWDNYITCDFPDLSVIPGNTYFIVARTSGGDFNNLFCWDGCGIANIYPRGNCWLSGDCGSTWLEEELTDLCFRTYGYNYHSPEISITYPDDGDTVNGTISINGIVSDPDGIGDVEWVMIQIDVNDWIEIDYSQTGIWTYIWDSTTVEDGSHVVCAVASDGSTQSAVVSKEFFVKNNEGPEPEKNPDLSSEGDFIWANVKPNEVKTGFFNISNIGESGSKLDWRIVEYPSWGMWSFLPDEGFNLTPEDGDVTVQVYITAPDEEESTFNGTIKIVNKENSSDYEIVQVSLTTPKNKLYLNTFYNLIEQLIKRFPFFEKILNQILL